MHTVLAFTDAFAFLVFVVGYTALARFLEPTIFGHVANTSAHEATRLVSIDFVPIAGIAFAFLRRGIDLHVVWSSPADMRHCHAWLMLCVVIASKVSRFCISSGNRTDEGALSKKRAFFIDTSKGSPEIDFHLRMFSCHSSDAISQAVRSEGKVFTLRIALMRLFTRGAVFGAYLVINAPHANARFLSVIPLITANAGLLTFITKT